MRKAGGTHTLVGLALALAGLLNGGLLPVHSKDKTTTRQTIAFKTGRARAPQPNRKALVNYRASHLNHSKPQQQDQPGAPAPVGTAKIAFSSDRDGNFEIYTMDADGGGLTRLTETDAEDFSPTWSPD